MINIINLAGTRPELKWRLGCYIDQAAPNRLLPHMLNTLKASVDYCLTYCYDLGYQFAGVQAYDWCLCGDDRPPYEKRVKIDECDMQCAGDSSQNCGNHWRMMVYELHESELYSIKIKKKSV